MKSHIQKGKGAVALLLAMVYGKLRNLVPAACGTAPGLHLDEDDLIPVECHDVRLSPSTAPVGVQYLEVVGQQKRGRHDLALAANLLGRHVGKRAPHADALRVEPRELLQLRLREAQLPLVLAVILTGRVLVPRVRRLARGPFLVEKRILVLDRLVRQLVQFRHRCLLPPPTGGRGWQTALAASFPVAYRWLSARLRLKNGPTKSQLGASVGP